MLKARRLILAVLAAGSLAPLLGMQRLIAAFSDAATPEARPLAAQLVSLLRARDSAAALGHVYLAAMPEEATADRLVALILPGRRAGEDSVLGDRQLRAMLGERHRSDFASGRTVVLHGWILSRTEARLYALSALTT